MKKLSLALAALLGFTLLSPSTAEAGGCRTRITYDNCGSCLHWEYRCIGRSYDGCPIYRWVVVSRSYPRVDYGYSRGGLGIYLSGGYRGGYRHGGGHSSHGGGYGGHGGGHRHRH